MRRRPRLPFRAVNRRDSAHHDPSLQRHHLLPSQLLSIRCFARLFDAVGVEAIGFDDFRRNGLLLPSREDAAERLALPLHRGPHRDYNAMVIEKVGQIEEAWAATRQEDTAAACAAALRQLEALQGALRLQLLDERRPHRLNRRDPAQREMDFSSLDALAEELWDAT
ncbi:AHH domain-containing protein [Qipengyuania sp. 6B39]|uniref:AHH domain-containing protein n=1 Tax=Qipengyuania proteolytica TaxID=2867239 RepID=UPI001C89621A|nr:AHH domain-containing protein [Qipengyuania proteolytica]MBX7495960.1 AHH domain-containing protein [Qipengyuania proteolytica]